MVDGTSLTDGASLGAGALRRAVWAAVAVNAEVGLLAGSSWAGVGGPDYFARHHAAPRTQKAAAAGAEESNAFDGRRRRARLLDILIHGSWHALQIAQIPGP